MMVCTGLPGAPPPPGLPGVAAPPAMIALPKKNIPKSANPLKSFNWTKLPDVKIKESIWSDLDDGRVSKLNTAP